MGPFTGQLPPVRAQPEKEMSPVGSSSSQTMIDFMPVILPLILPTRLTDLTPGAEPTFDPLDSQPVSDQERKKRKPVRIPAPANTARPEEPTQNPMQMILNVLRQKLSFLNIF